MDASYQYDKSAKAVTVIKSSKKAALKSDQIKLMGDEVFIPVRSLVEQLGFHAFANKESNTISITK